MCIRDRTRTVYFQYPTGRAIEPSTSVDNAQDLLVVGVSRFSETSIDGENLHADNLTNFADSRLIDDLREQSSGDFDIGSHDFSNI